MTKTKQILLTAAALLVLLGLGVITIYSLTFLIENIKTSLSTNPNQIQSNARFNLDGLKQIGIIK